MAADAPSPVSCDLTAAAARSAATSSAPAVVARAGAGVELLADAQRPLAVAEDFIGPGRAVVGGERHEPRPARRSRRSTCPESCSSIERHGQLGEPSTARGTSENLSPLGGMTRARRMKKLSFARHGYRTMRRPQPRPPPWRW